MDAKKAWCPGAPPSIQGNRTYACEKVTSNIVDSVPNKATQVVQVEDSKESSVSWPGWPRF